jgi:hypothetical protein
MAAQSLEEIGRDGGGIEETRGAAGGWQGLGAFGVRRKGTAGVEGGRQGVLPREPHGGVLRAAAARTPQRPAKGGVRRPC